MTVHALRQIGLVAVALVAMGQAAATRPAGGEVDVNAAVRPFVDVDTLLIAHADLGRVDLAQVQAFIEVTMQAPAQDGAELRQRLGMERIAAEGYLARLKGFGVRHAFLVMNQADAYPAMSGPAVLLKVDEGGDAGRLEEFLKTLTSPETVVRLGDVVAIASRPATLERLKGIAPAARPELTFSGRAPVEVVIAPTADQKRVVRELLPTLPAAVGGGSTEPLVGSLQNVRVELELPPQPRLTVTVSHGGAGAGAGEAWRALAARMKAAVMGSRELAQALETPPLAGHAEDARRLLEAVLTPQSGGEASGALIFRVNGEQFQSLVRLVLGPAVERARVQARRVASMQKIRQLLLGCIMYASEHGEQLPATLQEVERYLEVPLAEAIKNPNDPQGRPFVYRPLADGGGKLSRVKNSAGTPLIWEQTDAPDGFNVGFVDGHVEFMRREAAEKLIRETDPATTRPGQ
jgi:prepilin-type processing-associated H-X9-DG protein